MATTRYWNPAGSPADWTATSSWSETNGGATGASKPNTTNEVYFTASNSNTCTVNEDANMKSLDCTGFTGTMNNTDSLYSVGDITFVAGMTYTGTGKVQLSGSGSSTFTTAGKTFGKVDFSNSGDVTVVGNIILSGTSVYLERSLGRTGEVDFGAYSITANATYFYIESGFLDTNDSALYDLTFNAANDNDSFMWLSGNLEVTNNLVIEGTSASVRTTLKSSSSTQRTITAASVSCESLNVENIKGAGAGSWDLSAITGGSGDLGGNTDITFTTADDCFWVGGTGNWGDTAEWSTSSGGAGGQRVPLPQDDVYFDANSFSAGSQTVTVNLTATVNDIDWTGATNSPTFAINDDINLMGSFTLISAMTVSVGAANFRCRGTASGTIDTAGHTMPATHFSRTGGTITLASDLDMGTSQITINGDGGTVDAVSYDIDAGGIAHSAGTLNMGSGTWTSSIDWATVVLASGVVPETATVKFTNTGNGNCTLQLGEAGSYPNVWFDRGTSTGQNIFANWGAAATIKQLKDTGTEAHQITGSSSAMNLTSLDIAGSDGKLITISGCDWVDTTGTNSVQYCSITDSNASGGATWRASTAQGNVDGGSNTGWDFSPSDMKTFNGLAHANVKTINGLPIANVKNFNGLE